VRWLVLFAVSVAVTTVTTAATAMPPQKAERASCVLDIRILDVERRPAPAGLTLRVTAGDFRAEQAWTGPAPEHFGELPCRNALVEAGLKQTVRGKQRFRALGAAFVELPEASGRPLALNVPVLGLVTVTVLDTEGTPVAHTGVSFSPSGPDDTESAWGGTAVSDAEGHAELLLQPGAYKLGTVGAAHVTAARVKRPGPGSSPACGIGDEAAPGVCLPRGPSAVEVNVERALTLAGRVVDGAGRGSGGLRIVARTGSGRDIIETVSAADGSFAAFAPALPMTVSVFDDSGQSAFDPERIYVQTAAQASLMHFAARAYTGPRVAVTIVDDHGSAVDAVRVIATICPRLPERERVVRTATGHGGALSIPCARDCALDLELLPGEGSPFVGRLWHGAAETCGTALNVALERTAPVVGRRP
jgi:hypothetical protein